MARNGELLLGLGANLGDPAAQLASAVEMLASLGRIDQVSSLYRTAPVGYLEQPDFLNVVCAVETPLPLERILQETQRMEASLGRESTFRNAPRRIDIDVLACGELVFSSPTVTVPHPRMHERAFVLVPLVEIRPRWVHPVLGKDAKSLLAELPDAAGVERIGRLR